MKVVKLKYIALVLPALMFLTSYLLAINVQFPSHGLVLAITMDFVLTAPLLYFFLIRKTSIPNYTAISLFVVATIAASYIFPEEHQTFLTSWRYYVIPLIELTVLCFVIYKFAAISTKFKASKQTSPDFLDKLKLACEEALPSPFANFLATEISVFYYVFNFSKSKNLAPNEFTYHRKSGSALVLGTLMGLILAETFAIHFLVAHWSTNAAWILSFLSIYTCLQVIALIRSLGRRPTFVDTDNTMIHLRYGFFSETRIDIGTINRIEMTARTLPDASGMQKISVVGEFDNHNLVFYLDEPCAIQRVYGKELRTKILAVYIDDSKGFVDMIEKLQ